MKGIRLLTGCEGGGAVLVTTDGTGVTVLPGERYSTAKGFEKFNKKLRRWEPVHVENNEEESR